MIVEINDFFFSLGMYIEFEKDIKIKRVVEWNIEIIGEVMSWILRVELNILISNFRKIVDIWNWIIYGYDFVLDEVFWFIIICYFFILEKEIRKIK